MIKKSGVFLMIALTVTLLFSVNSPAAGAGQPFNEVRTSFHYHQVGAGFSFDGVLFPSFQVTLTPASGLQGGLEIGSSWYNILAYYYQNNLFQQDQLSVGLLPITWSSGKSVTLANSLAPQTFGIFVNKSSLDQYSFNHVPRGVGLKYATQLDTVLLTASLTNTPNEDWTTHNSLDLTTRLSFAAGEKLTVGAGLAAGGLFSDTSRHGFLVDAVFTDERLGFLGEFVHWQWDDNKGTGTAKSGFYLEGYYGLNEEFQLYAGIFAADELVDDRLVLGGKYQATSNLVYQAELCDKRDDMRLTLHLKVLF